MIQSCTCHNLIYNTLYNNPLHLLPSNIKFYAYTCSVTSIIFYSKNMSCGIMLVENQNVTLHKFPNAIEKPAAVCGVDLHRRCGPIGIYIHFSLYEANISFLLTLCTVPNTRWNFPWVSTRQDRGPTNLTDQSVSGSCRGTM